MHTHQKEWITFSLAGRLDGHQLQQLLDAVDGNIESVFSDIPRKVQAFNLPIDWADMLRSPNTEQLTDTQRWLENPGHHLVHWQHPNYPPLLKHIPNPPPLLYMKGNPRLFDTPHIGMVGSRYPSPQGIDIAETFAMELTQAGSIVCSGLALGIDAASHRGAISLQQKTTAVLGNGLSHLYPTAHRRLADDILAYQGVLVSEFPLHFPPHPTFFPQRNRIISGVSLGVVVVEAALRSGSLITARYAGEQGREVFAIPSSIENPLSTGCHQLIQQGAKLVTCVADILQEFPQFFSILPTTQQRVRKRGQTPKHRKHSGNKLENPLLMLLESVALTPTSMDRLIRKTKRSAEEITALLLQLELAGKVQRVAGGYVRNDNLGPEAK